MSRDVEFEFVIARARSVDALQLVFDREQQLVGRTTAGARFFNRFSDPSPLCLKSLSKSLSHLFRGDTLFFLVKIPKVVGERGWAFIGNRHFFSVPHDFQTIV